LGQNVTIVSMQSGSVSTCDVRLKWKSYFQRLVLIADRCSNWKPRLVEQLCILCILYQN